ncbi:MAG: DUF423 domain-containing protein, partial [Anaerolineae bacterium]
TYELAVRYQFIHSLALVATAVAVARWPSNAALASGWLFAIGIVLFSGSRYAMALIGAKGLAAATPIGGLLLIAGWAALAVAAWRGG